MRLYSQIEYLGAWLCGAGALLLLVGWRLPETVLVWAGAATLAVGVLLWLRRANRRRMSKWVKENEDV